MKTLLLTIGFAVCGILTSQLQAQTIELTIDPAQSSIDLSINGSSSDSPLSGVATLELQSSGPPSGTAQLTEFNLVADDGLNFTLFRFLFASVTASSDPGDVTISMATPGAAGTIAGDSFTQLSNMFEFGGDLNVSDPLGLAGGSQTVDLAEIGTVELDLDSVSVTQSGDTITISSTFSLDQNLEFGTNMVPVIVEGTFVATGVLPSVLLGDVNTDGLVDFQDIPAFIQVLTVGVFQAEADCDESGEVDFRDIAVFIGILSS